LAWAAAAPSAAQRRERVNVVRRFALFMHAQDERHDVPSAFAFGKPVRKRRMPHIFTPDEIQNLLAAAARLAPAGSIRPVTYVVLLSLLACTGLRISEALALQIDDVTCDGLVVRGSKFRKSRLVPLHATARVRLEQYLQHRQRIAGDDRRVFVSIQGTGLPYSTVCAVFLALIRSIGLRAAPGTPGPCLHDLRHTFAVRALESCQGDPAQIARHTLALSTYLGHAHASDTFWYIHATPTLLDGIATAGERLFEGGLS
jgi:integrase